ncbi:MAG: 2-oxo acid dehydrogenase subunit E2 [Armatimonadetes bacterium]|nr:2-oxo acid dehydrogenase subunit E2 [Armatimonadota bacterium]
MTEVIMPKMGDGMEEGTLLEWLVKDGEKVKSGQIIGNIQTDKATLEFEATSSGIITGFLMKPGDTVPVGKPIALILKDGEKAPGDWGSGKAATAAPVETVKVEELAPATMAPAAVASNERVKASPLAKKLAAEKGVDLSAVTGTGPNGRITSKDIEGAPVVAASAPTTPAPVAMITPTGEDKKVPLNRLRQIIAQRTQHSKQTVPHFYVTVEVDLERIEEMRASFEADGSGKVSINDFVVKASAKALQDMPEVNATFQGDSVLQYGAVHIGIAAAVDDGLLVPVIKNAHTMTIRQLSVAAKTLVKKAREGKLHPDEMSGSTFSISNMGMLDVDSFSAIINEPNCGIIAIGTARRKACVVGEDELEIRWRMNITGSFDHRVVDGAIGAKFVNVIRAYLENPTRLID